MVFESSLRYTAPVAGRKRTRGQGWLALGLVLSCLSCQVPAAVDLDEQAAGEVLLALEENRIAASRQSDPDSPKRFRIMVSQTHLSRAAGVLAVPSVVFVAVTLLFPLMLAWGAGVVGGFAAVMHFPLVTKRVN